MSETELMAKMREGDAFMRSGQPREAQRAYREAWSLSKDGLDEFGRVWLLLSIANASVRAEDYEEAFDACAGALNGFAETRVVVGNPLFHLIAGLACHGLGEDPGAVTDHMARALICGGPAIFASEDPRHLERMQAMLRPPAELGTWVGYEGCSRDLLNGATGYLAELLEARLGKPPPYVYEPDE